MRAFDDAEMAAVLADHKLWLAGAAMGKRAYLRGAILREADLSGANLRGANLRGANLREAILSRADLGAWHIRSRGPIGSRDDTLTHKMHPAVDGREAVDEAMTGCFRGTLTELEAANEARTDGNTAALEQYRQAIAWLRAEAGAAGRTAR